MEMLALSLVSLGKAAIVFIVGAGAGFGAGRVKNTAKLKAVASELTMMETAANAEIRSIASRLREHLSGKKPT